jgi:asparagine synthase (glutamine-hydrolysing)
VLLTGELGNWNISASPTSLLGDLVRENRWRSWAREAHSLVRNRQARWRGVLARSFGSGLPRGATRLLTYLSSGATTPAEMLLRPDILASLTQEDETSGRARHPWPNDFHKERLSALTEVDYGEYRKGVLAGWGIDKRDVTADRKLMEFCMALPLDMLLKKGERRPLARAALADRLPQAVTEERRKGYQAADWHVALTRDVPAIRGLAERIADDANGASIIHIDALYQLIREWPAGGWERPNVIIRYRSALLHALAAGHFLLSAKA